MIITSPAFAHYQSIPAKYTCEGANISPPLHFTDVPSHAKSLVLIVDDPDADKIFDHWITWNLSPTTDFLPENVTLKYQGLNSYNQAHYRGPCPPPGKPHRYFFKLYAIDCMLDLPLGIRKNDLEKAMEGHILAKSELIGIYQR